jgi:alginate O-acetyltransferase complex protein AlgI
MSYTIDVYRGKIQAERNFFDFALYVAFFPQLIAGPIERATRLLSQIVQPLVIKVESFFRGVLLFYWGLFLKIFIADNLARIVDPIFSQLSLHNGSEVLIAVYAFSFQIFCDFLGYSLMAIGLAKVMGIELMENFRQPYFSRNIAEFWRRWHISLSSWLRDYLYVPLGGNQKGASPHIA